MGKRGPQISPINTVMAGYAKRRPKATLRQIADVFGVTFQRVSQVLGRAGVQTHPAGRPRGGDHH